MYGSGLSKDIVNEARVSYLEFIKSTNISGHTYRLTLNAEPSPYARCFALFGYALLQQESLYLSDAKSWALAIKNDLKDYQNHRKTQVDDLLKDKAYLQLLTFSLSALAILGELGEDPLEEFVRPILERKVDSYFEQTGVLDGKAGTGNLAMFLGVLLIHAREYLKIDTTHQIDQWCALHLKYMNKFGFWGKANSMSHLQFQNGYHQYEIFDYLGINNPLATKAADWVASLSDSKGHFSPYVGGGGCYDYDAIFVITSAGKDAVDKHRTLILKTVSTILSEQNKDGGFAESKYVRPRSISNLYMSLTHIMNSRGQALIERSRHAISLMRPRHNRITTHWSKYSREWDESDLWDSWFRMMLIARVEVATSSCRREEWGFINYPGIGYYPTH